MTQDEAVAEAARLTARLAKGEHVRYTAQQLCRGWAVERRVATTYYAWDGYIHVADHVEQAGG